MLFRFYLQKKFTFVLEIEESDTDIVQKFIKFQKNMDILYICMLLGLVFNFIFGKIKVK